MTELDLEPHEQLDEIDRRTNDDGTVEVELLGWYKKTGIDRVRVDYRIPTGEVKNETMDWPKSNDPSFKFIRLIEQTPYTLRTAEGINDDGTLKVNANPNRWRLDLPKEKKFHEYVPGSRGSFPFEAAKFLLYPLSLVAMVANLLEKSGEYVGYRGEEYDDTYLESDMHLSEHVSAIKSAVYTFLWVLVALALIL